MPLNQFAFIVGRNIQDNILLSRELHNYHKGEALARWVAKVDLKKAYDSVHWETIEFNLRRIGVSDKIVNWIMVCVNLPSFYVMINGAPYSYFRGKRRISCSLIFLFLLWNCFRI